MKETLDLCLALYEGGRITWEEYFFYCALPIDRLSEYRHFSGDYKNTIGPIDAKIREVEAKHGLRDGQYWRKGQGPEEYRRLNARYEKKLDNYAGNLFRELGLKSHERLWRKDREQFDRLNEAGRLSISNAADLENATLKLISMFEQESKTCAAAKAYYAACLMLGSASEAVILLKCIQVPSEVAVAKSKIVKSNRFDKRGPLYWNLGQLILIAKEAGWATDLQTKNFGINIVSLVERLQGLRNLVHPGRHAINAPHFVIREEQYQDARAAYVALRHGIERQSNKRPRKATKRQAD